MNYLIIYLYVLCFFKIEVIGLPMTKIVFPNEESDEDFIYGKLPTLPTAPESEYDEKLRQQHNKPHHKFPIDETKMSCLTFGTMQFCEDDENEKYPDTEYIESLLKKTNGTFNKYLDKVKTRDDFSDASEPIPLCETYKRKFYPRIAKNEKHNNWHFIINSAKYHQPIRVEICHENSSPCLFHELFPFVYSPLCTQKYSKMPLIAFDTQDEIFRSEYEYPSHCSCDLYRKT